MRKRSFAKLGTAAVALSLAALTACGSSGSGSVAPEPGATLSKSPIVIGNVGQYSGSSFGGQYLQAVHSLQAWVKWTNEHGGLNGHPVKLVWHDDVNNPAKALQYVKEMVENDHIVALVGTVDSGADNAWTDYVKQKKLPVIGGLSVDANWDKNPYMLSANVTIGNYLTGTLVAAKSVGTKVGEFACAELVACKTGVTAFEGIAKQLGLGWAGAQLVSATATDYTAQCAAMKSAGADVVVPEVDGPTAVRVIKGCNTQGYKPALVVPASLINDEVLADPAFDGAVGVASSPLWFGDADLTRDWREAYTAMFPDAQPNGYATLGWQAGVVFGTALKNAPDTVTSDTVLQSLYALPAGSTFGGWTPPLTFSPGKTTATQPCMWQVQIKNGKLTAPQGNKYVCAS